MDSNLPNQFQGLREIRNGVLLLSLGNNYLCEVPFLKKIGESIHSQIDPLRGDILALKEQFPGKFVDEIDTETVLEEIGEISLRLQNPDQELNEKCTIGELGIELETHLEKLTNTIGSLRDQVEGVGQTYTKKDSLVDMFGSVGRSGGYAASGLGKVFKILWVFLGICAIAFFALFFTMESQKDLLGKIATNEAHIRSQQEILAGLDREKQELMEQLKVLERDDMTRQEKLEAIDLNMKILNLEQRGQKLRLQIQVQLDMMSEHRKKIQEMQKKSFIQRLLRQ